MIKKIIIAGILLCAPCAMAADEAIVRDFLQKSDFSAEVKRNIRSSRAGLPANQVEKFIALIDFAKIEEAYAQSMMNSMSNDEMRVLVTAYALPGFQAASRKQLIAASSAIGAIVSEIERAAKALSKGK